MDDSEQNEIISLNDTPPYIQNNSQNNTITIEGGAYLFNMVAISIVALCIVNGLCKGMSRVHQYITKSRQTDTLDNLSNYLLANQDHDHESGNVEEGTCSICIETFTSTTHITLPCNHKFHTHCIKQWLEKELNCPLCRQSLQLN